MLLLSAVIDRDDVPVASKRTILYWWVAIFTLFRGLRWDVGTDWDQYLEVFSKSGWDNIFTYARNSSIHMEPGYIILNAFIKSFGFNYTGYLLLTNFFVLYAYARFSLTNSRNPVLVFVLFMFSTQFFPVRIGIAVAVLILGLCDFSKKRHLRVFICIFIAMNIHSSAMVFFPVYCMIFIKKIPTKLAVTVAFLWLQLASVPAYNDFLFSLVGNLNFLGEETTHKFENYLDYDPTLHGNTAIKLISGYLSSVVFIVLLWIFGNMITKKGAIIRRDNINFGFMFNVYYVFMMISIAFPGDNMAGLRRLQNYFMFAFPVLYAAYIVYAKNKYPNYRYFFTFMFIGYALFRVYALFFGRELFVNFPYRSVLDDVF
ncbi:MAG: EpsG family protein [Sphingobacteriaceae bacterium]|nr:MAG: EpsG family protein [Sphingobacteriaceae bacterium]